MIDYIAIMSSPTPIGLRQKYHGGRNDGFLTDVPRPPIQLSDDDYVRVRYDAKTMRWIANRPSRIKYQTARQLIEQYRKEYAEKWG